VIRYSYIDDVVSEGAFKISEIDPNGTRRTLRRANQYGDTAWHVLRLYAFTGSNPVYDSTQTVLDGRTVVWLDDILLYDTDAYIALWDSLGDWQGGPFAAVNHYRPDSLARIQYIDLGRNKDGAGFYDTIADSTWAAPRTESLWWGYVKWWKEDPGWLMWPNDTPFVLDSTISVNWPPAADPYLYIDWSEYANEDSLLADQCADATQCRLHWDGWSTVGEWGTPSTGPFVDSAVRRIMLDTTVKPPAKLGATKSLRFDWRYVYGVCDSAESANPTTGGICSNLGEHNALIYLDTSVADPDPKNTTEIWASLWYRYGPNFSPCNLNDAPCGYKTVFIRLPNGNSRSAWRLGGRGETFAASKAYGWKVGNSGAGAGISHGPLHGDSMIWAEAAASHIDAQWNGAGTPLFIRYKDTLTSITDTMWHVVWIYHKQGSGTTPSTATLDGRIVMWIDSVLMFDSDYSLDQGLIDPWNNFNNDTNEPVQGFDALEIGNNKDKGGDDDTISAELWEVPRIEQMWCGPVSIYRQDPGWLMWPDVTPYVTTSAEYNYDPPGYPGAWSP
jgi:hypothetical protein